MSKHIYVLDTCVLLHDPHAIYRFEEHDIYIPLAVIDDLDEIKTKRENVGWGAREVLRQINKFSINELTKGVKVNAKGGRLFIFNHKAPINRSEAPVIMRVNSDNALIETCLYLKAQNQKRKVCLVTKDVGLMIRAVSFSVTAENYRHDMIDAKLYQGYRTIEINNRDLIDNFYKNETQTLETVMASIDEKVDDFYPNEFLILRHGDASVITIYKNGNFTNCFSKKKNVEYMGLTPKNLEQKLSTVILQDDTIPLVCLAGAAGTGKSILALSVGLQKIKDGVYDKLVVIKPLIPVGGKEIGFLPGDKFSKISAWLGPIKDNLEQLVGIFNDEENEGKGASAVFEDMCEEGIIEVEAMTFIQGRSITNAFIVVDEAENNSPRESRMLVERVGRNSKIVLLGDLSQIENPYLDQYSCGLTHAIQGGKSSPLVGSVELKKVERSALAEAATEIFKKGMNH